MEYIPEMRLMDPRSECFQLVIVILIHKSNHSDKSHKNIPSFIIRLDSLV